MIAVLFDFNGVLVDDEDVHFEAFRRILEVLGVTVSHEVYRRYLGFDDRGTIVALLAHYGRGGDVDDGELGRLVARKQRSYARLAGEHPRLGFGARALVLALRAAGARLAIVSGARRAEIDAVLDASSLRDCFDAIVAAEDVTRGKPDPEGYRLARARLDAVAGAPLARRRDRGRARRVARGARRGRALHRPRHHLSRRRARRRRRDRVVARRAGRAGVDSSGGCGRRRRPRRCPILFTPGPVRVPPAVTRALVDPPCNYHRQDAFCALRADIERDIVGLLGIRDPAAYQAAVFTATGTGANEACLLALAGTGPGLIAANGFFAARLVEQAARNGIAHRVLEAPPDRPLDPAEIDRALAAAPELRWLYVVSHETRAGLKNPLSRDRRGRAAARRGRRRRRGVERVRLPDRRRGRGPGPGRDVVVQGDRRRARAGDRAGARGVPRAAARRARRRLLPGSRRGVRQAAAREPAALRAAGGAVRGAGGGVRAPAIGRRGGAHGAHAAADAGDRRAPGSAGRRPPRCPRRTVRASP